MFKTKLSIKKGLLIFLSGCTECLLIPFHYARLHRYSHPIWLCAPTSILSCTLELTHKWDSSRANSQTHNTHHYKYTTFISFIFIKGRQNLNDCYNMWIWVRMCHNWFSIDYFWLNFHLIIEMFVHICWRNEFIIVRNWNCFEFCPTFDKDCLHFQKWDASAPPLWRITKKKGRTAF